MSPEFGSSLLLKNPNNGNFVFQLKHNSERTNHHPEYPQKQLDEFCFTQLRSKVCGRAVSLHKDLRSKDRKFSFSLYIIQIQISFDD